MNRMNSPISILYAARVRGWFRLANHSTSARHFGEPTKFRPGQESAAGGRSQRDRGRAIGIRPGRQDFQFLIVFTAAERHG